MNKKMKSLRRKYILAGLVTVVFISMLEVGMIKRNVQANEKTNSTIFSKDESAPEDYGFEGQSIKEGLETVEKDIKDEDLKNQTNKNEDVGNVDTKDTADAMAVSDDTDSAEVKKESEQKKEDEEKIISIECLYQGDGYPSGCEIFSTEMLLNYYGYNYSIEDIINVLPIGNLYYEGNERVGPSPYTCFIGNPSTEDGFCCYEPVIEQVLKKMVTDREVVNATGRTLNELCSKYIDNGIPVVIWGAVGMQPATSEITWRIEGTDEYYSWPNTEHCLLLVGYDDDGYYFNDPMTGELTEYDKELTADRYSELGMQAVTIID